MRIGVFRIYFILLLALNSCSAPGRKADPKLLETVGSAANSFFDIEEIDSALIYLDKCLAIDHKYAPAHYLLGKIYLLKDGIYNRRLSALSLKAAIRAEKENPEYHYSLGVTLEKQGFYLNALNEYKKAAALDTTDFRPLGKIAGINERIGLRYDDDKYFKRSLEASARAALLSHDPGLYYQQAITLYQLGRYDSSSAILSKVIAESDSAPLLAKSWLLLGAELTLAGEFDSAGFCFENGRALASGMARDEMDDLRFLMPASEYGRFWKLSFYAQETEARRFWGRLDPDPTTQINERKLAHYARFVHAQLTYSIPERIIDGWKTKRGELYIRYGLPTEQRFSLGEGGSDPPKWIWVYGQLARPATFVFEDTFLNGEFDFPFPNKNWTADDYARDPSLLAAMLGSSQPELYEYAAGSGPLQYAYLTRQFKGSSGRTDLEVFAAIPHTQLKFRRDGEYASASVDWRQVLRYANWQLADSVSLNRTYRVRAAQTENPELSLSDRLSLSEYPDSLVFSIALRDTVSNHIGIATRDIRLRNFYTGKVEISDLVLARRIVQPPDLIDFKRNQVGIYSNLDTRYFAGEPVWLYFEIYNLARAADGRTSYTIKQTLAEKRAGGVLGILAGAVGGRDLHEVVTTYNGSSARSDENRVLMVDVSQMEAGTYLLSIEISDLISGKSAIASEDIVLYRD